MTFTRFFQRRIAVSFLTILLCSILGPGAALAAATDRYWRGGMNASSEFENTINWSQTMGGDGGQAVPTAADTVYFMNNLSGASLIGKNVVIRSHAEAKGIVINKNMTGTILLGTGSLNFGSSGVRMGSGRLIGSGHILGGTSNLSGSGSFTQTGGIVRLGRTNLYLSGSLAISKGATSSYTEFVSTGTIMFNSRLADQNFTVGSTVSNTYFKNLTLNNTAGTTNDDIIASGSPLKLSGALLITRGNLDLAANDVALQVESGITVASNAQATFSTDANVTASGHIVVGALGVFTMSGTSTFTLNGINQNLDTNNNPLYNLTIGSSGTATLTSDQSVTHTLQVNTGSTLSLGTYTIYATGATIINYGTISEGTGKIKHNASTVKITDSNYTEDDSFTSGQLMYLTVTDGDENIDGTAADTITVTLAGGSDTETVTLTETTKTSGIFRGSIQARASTSTKDIAVSAGDGIFQSNADVTVTLTYTDAQDAESTTDTASLTATVPTSTSTGGGSGGGGGGGGRARTTGPSTTVTTPVVPKTVTPKTTTLPTPKERVEARKQARSAMLSRANERAAKRKVRRGL